MTKEGQPPKIEREQFPEGVLPTIGFLSKLPDLKNEPGIDGIKHWEGKTFFAGSELTINVRLQPEIHRIKNLEGGGSFNFPGVKSFSGREARIWVSKDMGDNEDAMVEDWVLLEDLDNSRLIISMVPCLTPSMLLPNAKSHMYLELVGTLAVAKGKLGNMDDFVTEGDIDKESSDANWWHFRNKIVTAPLSEMFKVIEVLKDAILSAEPTED